MYDDVVLYTSGAGLQALAADNGNAASEAVGGLHQVVNTVDGQSLEGKAAQRWEAEQSSPSQQRSEVRGSGFFCEAPRHRSQAARLPVIDG